MATSWPPTSSSNYGKDGMFTLLVGEKEQELLAHESYLSLHSEFFKAALKKEWIEGQTRTVKLPEEKLETMTFYLDFLYGKGLPTDFTKEDTREAKVYELLTELFALGERLLDSVIRNATVKEIIRFATIPSKATRWFPNQTAISNIYNSTTATSPARRLLVALYVSNGHEGWIGPALHPVFCQELVKALLTHARSSSIPSFGQELTADDYLV